MGIDYCISDYPHYLWPGQITAGRTVDGCSGKELQKKAREDDFDDNLLEDKSRGKLGSQVLGTT